MGDEEFLWLTGALEEAEEVYMDNFELRQRIAELEAELGSGTCAFARPTDLTDGCAALERIAELERENERLRAIVESRPAGCWADDAR